MNFGTSKFLLKLALQVLMYSALTNLACDGKPYPTAQQPGKLPVTLEEMESHTVQAVQELQCQQEQQLEVNTGTNNRQQTRSGATYFKDAPIPPGLLSISSRLADGVFLGRQLPLPLFCLASLLCRKVCCCTHKFDTPSSCWSDRSIRVLLYKMQGVVPSCFNPIGA